jgi:hypothetical protein
MTPLAPFLIPRCPICLAPRDDACRRSEEEQCPRAATSSAYSYARNSLMAAHFPEQLEEERKARRVIGQLKGSTP